MPQNQSIGRLIAGGAAWLMLVRFSVRVIGIVSTLILARLLVPDDFGLVALATMVQGLVQAFGAWGFDYSLFVDRVTASHYNTAWTLNLIKNGVMALVIAGASPFLADFYGDYRLVPVLICLAIATIIGGFNNIWIINLRKELQMRREFNYLVLPKVGGFIVTVALAIVIHNYWALVGGIIASQLVSLIASYVMIDARPRLGLEHWRSMMKVSTWVLVSNIAQTVAQRLDVMVLGKVADARVVGVYNIASEVSNLATSEMIMPIRSALFPGYAKCADRPDLLREMYLDAFSLGILIGAPVSIGIGLVADPLISIMFGSKWLEAIPLLQLLAFAGFFQAANATSSTVILSTGRAKLFASIQVIAVVAQASLLVAAAGHGAEGIAAAMIAASGIATTLFTIGAVRVTKTSTVQLFSRAWRSLFATVVMFVVVSATSRAIAMPVGFWGSLFALLLLAAVGAFVYTLVVTSLWAWFGRPRSAEAIVLAELTARWRRWRPA